MKEELISFEVAKLAKEKGFDEFCNYHYCYGFYDKKEPIQGDVFIGGFINDSGENRKYKNSELSNWELPYGEFSAPTQSLLQRWLREVHNIHIMIEPYYDKNKNLVYGFDLLLKETEEEHICEDGFKTYEEALEKGLQEGLKMI